MSKLFLGLLSLASAHNWVKSPPTRNGNAAAQVKPCPPAGDDYMPLEVDVGAAIGVTWSTNHDGDHWLKVVPSADESTLETSDNADAVFYETYANDIATGQFSLNSAGSFVVQYGWSGYRNCFDVTAIQQFIPPSCANADLNNVATQQNGGGCHNLMGARSECVLDNVTNTQVCNCKTGYMVNEGGVCVSMQPASEFYFCPEYCQDALAQCTMYADYESCLNKCSTIPFGLDGDVNANTLMCRYHHLHIEADPALHCAHASFSGGGSTKCGADAVFPAGLAMTVNGASPTQVEAGVRQAMVDCGLCETSETCGTHYSSSGQQADESIHVVQVWDNATSVEDLQSQLEACAKAPGMLQALQAASGETGVQSSVATFTAVSTAGPAKGTENVAGAVLGSIVASLVLVAIVGVYMAKFRGSKKVDAFVIGGVLLVALLVIIVAAAAGTAAVQAAVIAPLVIILALGAGVGCFFACRNGGGEKKSAGV